MNKIIVKQDFQNKDNYYYNLVKQNIKKCRNYFDLTQEQLAEKLGTDVKYYSHLEQKRNCPLHIAGNISELLMIPITTLFKENLDFPKQNLKITHHDNNYYYDVVRKNIRKFRKYRGISQIDLSIKINHARGYISALENGNKNNDFPISTITRISEVLNIPLENFFEEEKNILERIN